MQIVHTVSHDRCMPPPPAARLRLDQARRSSLDGCWTASLCSDGAALISLARSCSALCHRIRTGGRSTLSRTANTLQVPGYGERGVMHAPVVHYAWQPPMTTMCQQPTEGTPQRPSNTYTCLWILGIRAPAYGPGKR